MFTKTLVNTLLATTLAFPLFAQTAPTVKSVDVTVNIAAVANPKAASYWTTFEGDLEAAILAKITDQIADDGINLIIDVSEVELSNGFDEQMGFADTRMVAAVKMTHDTDNTRFGAYELTVDVNQVIPMLPEGTDINVLNGDTKTYYDAMVKAFANGVVERLK